jgi:hypothetical protein
VRVLYKDKALLGGSKTLRRGGMLGLLIDQKIGVRDGVEVNFLGQKVLALASSAHLQMRLDADLAIRGPDLRRARADLKAKGHLWLALRDRDLSLAQDPFQVRLEGALFAGDGSFDVSGVSLALLALLTPVPESQRGHLGLRGRYRLGSGRPEVAMDLTLDDGALAQRALRLDRGHLELTT